MGFLLLFILVSWSNSQVISAAHCHGITSHDASICVVTTLRIGLLLFPLLVRAITITQ
jgi:hypothetical protein